MLIGAGGIVAAGGALVGTGAFTTVQAERTVEVSTAGDDSALLRLDTISDSPNSTGNGNTDGYAEINGGTLEVTIPDVNLDAVTHIDNVFQVTNNGSQPVVLYFQELPGNDNPDGNSIDAGVRTDQLDADDVGPDDQPTSNGIYDEDVVDVSAQNGPESSPTYSEIGIRLAAGETLKVGIYIDTSEDLNDGLDDDDSESSGIGADETLMENLVIYASAEAEQNGDWQFEQTKYG